MSDLRRGDEWITAGDGGRYWGRYGAAGLLAYDSAQEAILLQHRVTWSDHGDTWGIPGGAKHADESDVDAAIREAQEEAGVPDGVITPRFTHVLDRGGWTYTTVIADVDVPFTPQITDPESHALAWVSCDRVEDLPLHPGFAASWPILRPLLGLAPVTLVDAANVVGSVPDGWWKDRSAAARRLIERTALLAQRGVRSGFLGLTGSEHPGLTLAYPDWEVVLEGSARGAPALPHVRPIDAPELGDDALVGRVTAHHRAGRRVTVVTSDAELVARALAAGAANTRGSGALVKRLPELAETSKGGAHGPTP